MKKAMELSRSGDPAVKAEVTPICMELMTTLEQVSAVENGRCRILHCC